MTNIHNSRFLSNGGLPTYLRVAESTSEESLDCFLFVLKFKKMAEKKIPSLVEKVAPRVKETHSKEAGQELVKKALLLEALEQFSQNSSRILELRSEVALLELKNAKLVDKFPPLKFLKGNILSFGKSQISSKKVAKPKEELSLLSGEQKEKTRTGKAEKGKVSANQSSSSSNQDNSSNPKRKSPETMEVLSPEFDPSIEKYPKQ